jgi:iron(III) transport system substrate-binding protein
MRSLCKSALLIGGLLLGSLAFAQKTQLLVYTALEVDQLKAYQGSRLNRCDHSQTVG